MQVYINHICCYVGVKSGICMSGSGFRFVQNCYDPEDVLFIWGSFFSLRKHRITKYNKHTLVLVGRIVQDPDVQEYPTGRIRVLVVLDPRILICLYV